MTTTRVLGNDAVDDAATQDRSAFRGDIDGLRALAIVIVVLFHAGVDRAEGGFIGVDVFFVVSGYLITSKLLSEGVGTGSIRLGTFWAKRIRRLVPALTLMVLVTLAASVFVLPGFAIRDTAIQGASAAVYVSNILFARQAQDYFGADIESSPFLHTWSLGVEEQFYLVWPVLVLLCLLIARRGPRRHLRAIVVLGLSTVFCLSMACNLWLADQASVWTFFGLPSRMWEFAAAGLLAAMPLETWLRSWWLRTSLGVAGIALLAVGLVTISPSPSYPGLAALVPVSATLALIAAGTRAGRASPVSSAMSFGPLQWLGRVSYSWYLWHWPFIVLAVAATGDNTSSVRLAAAAGSLPVAYAAHRLVENPLRFSPSLVASMRSTYLLGAGATTAAVLIAVGIYGAGGSGGVLTGESTSLDQRIQAAWGSHNHKFCEAKPRLDGAILCDNGDPVGARTVLLLGDSHAGQWKLALDRFGEHRGVRVVDRVRNACPATPVRVVSEERGEQGARDCVAWQQESLDLIAGLRPDVIVLAQWAGYLDRIQRPDGGAPRDDDERVALWREAQAEYLDSLVATGVPVVIVLDNPHLRQSPLDCIDRTRSTTECEPTRQEALALNAGLRAVDTEEAARRPVEVVDMVEVLCDAARCRVEADGALVYSDRQHLSADYTVAAAYVLTDAIDRALTRAAR